MMFFWAEFAENWFGAGSPVKSLFAQTANTFLYFCVFRHICFLHFFILQFCFLHFCIYQSPVKSFLAESLFYILNYSYYFMILQIPIYIKLPFANKLSSAQYVSFDRSLHKDYFQLKSPLSHLSFCWRVSSKLCWRLVIDGWFLESTQ